VKLDPLQITFACVEWCLALGVLTRGAGNGEGVIEKSEIFDIGLEGYTILKTMLRGSLVSAGLTSLR
jgi:hypothetical protein